MTISHRDNNFIRNFGVQSVSDRLNRVTMKVLVVQEIEKSYGDRQILRGCNFTVDTVERVGIVGANGAGKSTLLRLISEVESADAGVIYRNGSVAILEQEPVLSGETVE